MPSPSSEISRSSLGSRFVVFAIASFDETELLLEEDESELSEDEEFELKV